MLLICFVFKLIIIESFIILVWNYILHCLFLKKKSIKKSN